MRINSHKNKSSSCGINMLTCCTPDVDKHHIIYHNKSFMKNLQSTFFSSVCSSVTFLHTNKRNGVITHGLMLKRLGGVQRNATLSIPLHMRLKWLNNESRKSLKMITYPSPNWDFCKLQVLPFRTRVVGLTRSLHALWTCLSPNCIG